METRFFSAHPISREATALMYFYEFPNLLRPLNMSVLRSWELLKSQNISQIPIDLYLEIRKLGDCGVRSSQIGSKFRRGARYIEFGRRVAKLTTSRNDRAPLKLSPIRKYLSRKNGGRKRMARVGVPVFNSGVSSRRNTSLATRERGR